MSRIEDKLYKCEACDAFSMMAGVPGYEAGRVVCSECGHERPVSTSEENYDE